MGGVAGAIAAAGIAVGAMGIAPRQADASSVCIGVSVGAPMYVPPPVMYQPPVYYAPPVYQPPVYYAPPVYQPPVYYAPPVYQPPVYQQYYQPTISNFGLTVGPRGFGINLGSFGPGGFLNFNLRSFRRFRR